MRKKCIQKCHCILKFRKNARKLVNDTLTIKLTELYQNNPCAVDFPPPKNDFFFEKILKFYFLFSFFGKIDERFLKTA